MVTTDKAFGGTGSFPAESVAAMKTNIEKNADLPVLAAHDDDRLYANRRGHERAGIRHFAFVSNIDPVVPEDALHLFVEQARRVVDAGIDAETVGRLC